MSTNQGAVTVLLGWEDNRKPA